MTSIDSTLLKSSCFLQGEEDPAFSIMIWSNLRHNFQLQLSRIVKTCQTYFLRTVVEELKLMKHTSSHYNLVEELKLAKDTSPYYNLLVEESKLVKHTSQ